MIKIISVIIYLVFACITFLAFNRFGVLIRLSSSSFPINIIDAINNFDAPGKAWLIFVDDSYKTGLIGVFIIFCIWFYNIAHKRNYRKGAEHGSARWGKKKDFKDLTDEKFEKNLILAKDLYISSDTRMRSRNNNHILVIGGSGSGKTRFFLKPNLMQMNSNYVITDPKGEVISSCGKLLAEKGGYKIKVLNLIDMKYSDKYNPFKYIRPNHNEDVMTLINTIMINTNGSNPSGSSDPFWEKAEMLFLQSIFYLILSMDEDSHNMTTVMELIRAGKTPSDNIPSSLDLIMEEQPEDSMAKMQYDGFKQAAKETAQSIVISAYARLGPFNIPELANLVSEDTIDLDSIAKGRTCLFVLNPTSDKTFNFVAAILFSQLFQRIDYIVNQEYGGHPKNNVMFLLDEFANIGTIPNFMNILTYGRSLGIGVAPIFQDLSQMKKMYEKDWNTISSNCESLLFLGGADDTAEYVSKKLGKSTIDITGESRNFGSQKSMGDSNQKSGRELLMYDEVERINRDECIVFIAKKPPFKGKKYNILNHPMYKNLSDADKSNTYDYIHIYDMRNRDKEAALAEKERQEEIEIIEANKQAQLTVQNISQEIYNPPIEENEIVESLDGGEIDSHSISSF